MTLRYAHLAPDYNRAAISRLDTYMDTRHKKGSRTTPQPLDFLGSGGWI